MLSRRQSAWLELARRVASASDQRNKHGAVIVRGGRVLSVGINKFRNHPDIIESEKIDEYCSVHAEVDALSRINSARGATIYVARVNNSGVSLISRPCGSCYSVISAGGISRIIYTTGKPVDGIELL